MNTLKKTLPIIPKFSFVVNKKWKPINQDWTDVLNVFINLAREKPDKKLWLNELSGSPAMRMMTSYHQRGIVVMNKIPNGTNMVFQLFGKRQRFSDQS